ncbi:hypothetical protein GW17_00035944, partial [Ensete ventricosum]
MHVSNSHYYLVGHCIETIINSLSHASDKLKSFRSYLRWMCIDYSSPPPPPSSPIFASSPLFVATASA